MSISVMFNIYQAYIKHKNKSIKLKNLE